MIEYLTVNINPPPLDKLIIVTRSESMIKACKGFDKTELKIYTSDRFNEQEVIDWLHTEQFDLWSTTEPSNSAAIIDQIISEEEEAEKL